MDATTSSTPGKKKARKRVGRHLKQNRRVEQRAAANEGKRELEEGACPESDKVTDPGNKFYSAFKELEENLVFKFAWSAKCSQPLKPERDTYRLSRDLVRLLRWNLPKLGIAYSRYDGSVRIAGAARYFHVPEGKIIDATTSSTKVRIVIFQRLSLEVKN